MDHILRADKDQYIWADKMLLRVYMRILMVGVVHKLPNKDMKEI
jgi:hypothetical protein